MHSIAESLNRFLRTYSFKKTSWTFETLEDIEKKLKNVVDGDDGENDGGAYK